MQSIRQQLCKYLCNKEEPERPFTTLRTRSATHILQILQQKFPVAQIKIRDEDLTEPTKREFEAWLDRDLGNYKKYHRNWYDCDDYAIELRHKMFKFGHEYKATFTVAYCEGYAPAGYHAYNLMIDSTDAVYIIEPQEDHIIPADQSKYKTDFIQL